MTIAPLDAFINAFCLWSLRFGPKGSRGSQAIILTTDETNTVFINLRRYDTTTTLNLMRPANEDRCDGDRPIDQMNSERKCHYKAIGNTHCVLVEHIDDGDKPHGERRFCLIDTSYLKMFSKLKAWIVRIAGSITAVDTIVMTHWHYDHAGCASRLVKAIVAAGGERPAVIAHHIEAGGITRGENHFPNGTSTVFQALVNTGRFLDRNTPLIRAIRMRVDPTPCTGWEEGMGTDYLEREHGYPLVIVPTPGHSDGSLTYVHRASRIAFVGDCAFNIFGRHMPPFGESIEQIHESWRRVVTQPVDTIVPAHGKAFPRENLEKLLGPQNQRI